MKQESTAMIPMDEYLELKNFRDEMMKNNRVAFYTGSYHFGNLCRDGIFITTDEAILIIEKYNAKLKDDFDNLLKKYNQELHKKLQVQTPEQVQTPPEKPKNIFSRFFKK